MKNAHILPAFLFAISFLLACEETNQNQAVEPAWQSIHFADWQEVNGGTLSPQAYQDFILEGEFFLADGQQNQILFGLSEGAGEAFSEGGLRINLDYNPAQQNTLGSIVDIARAKVLENVSTKAWNKISVSVLGASVELQINEQTVVTTQLEKIPEGKIGFQAAQDLVKLNEQFRNFRIKPLQNVESLEIIRWEELKASIWDNTTPVLQEKLDGWYQTGTATWTLEDGVLTGESGAEGGYLISDSLYKNLYLSTQFKIAKEDNSGIFIRLDPDSSNKISVQAGIECNIYDHNGFTHAYSTGSIVTHARAFSDLIDYDDWNQLEILATDNQVVLFVNGTESADHEFPIGRYTEAGQIALQAGIRVFGDNGPSRIQFKEMRLAVLDGF
ncbi:MAG: family 16 glycoside hydrolase [Bacteroidota bacterium]